MLEMVQVDYIKRLREVEECSISEIARRVDVDWRTAKKYADNYVSTQSAPKTKRNSPIMGPYEFIVDLWLEEDVFNPRKQRLTARKIFKELRKIGFKGSERTVRDYVKKRKQEIRTNWQEIYVRLEHDPGLAQVDFGQFKALKPNTGEIEKYYYLILSFPFSNNAFALALPSENTECFLTGLKVLFEQAGGVPREVWFDNLPTAVADILKNTERKLTSTFAEFQWYYRFKIKFCNVNSAHEKGNVESKVGYIRRNFLSPMPIIKDLNQFNEELRQELVDDRERTHYVKKKHISELWLEDQKKLLTLPSTPLEVCATTTRRVNKYGEINIGDKHPYPVPKAKQNQNIFIKIYWDKIEFFDEYGEELLGESPRVYMQNTENLNWSELLNIYRNKPRAIENGLYMKALPEVVREYLLSEDLKLRRQRISYIISLLEENSMTDIAAAIEQASEYQRTDLGSIKTILSYRQSNQKNSEEIRFQMDEALTWKPDLHEYNELLGMAVKPNE